MVAFCDIIEERARKAKQDYGTPDAAVYTDYRKLLEDKTIDVVTSAPPTAPTVSSRWTLCTRQARHVREADGNQCRRGKEDAGCRRRKPASC